MSAHADEEEESINENLSRAKLLIWQSETFMKWAVLRLADAEDLGASETEIAEALGRSVTWVKRKLKDAELLGGVYWGPHQPTEVMRPTDR